ncbi:hypothetical protein BZA77DRAFT_328760 [Pyronema omphalodes]|nr:hypothetical protein BZA77DRAFT_328760 [Pyronema omphalodes]
MVFEGWCLIIIIVEFHDRGVDMYGGYVWNGTYVQSTYVSAMYATYIPRINYRFGTGWKFWDELRRVAYWSIYTSAFFLNGFGIV